MPTEVCPLILSIKPLTWNNITVGKRTHTRILLESPQNRVSFTTAFPIKLMLLSPYRQNVRKWLGSTSGRPKKKKKGHRIQKACDINELHCGACSNFFSLPWVLCSVQTYDPECYLTNASAMESVMAQSMQINTQLCFSQPCDWLSSLSKCPRMMPYHLLRCFMWHSKDEKGNGLKWKARHLISVLLELTLSLQ